MINYTTISLILSSIVLLFSILDYYGYIRFSKLHLTSPITYINSFKKLPKGDTKNKVIVSISTSNKNLTKLQPTISSLLDQTVKVDMITLTIPYGKDYVVPDSIKSCVVEYRTGKTYGDATCLIPAILREGEATTKIITISDTMICGKDFIETLLNVSKKHPNSLVYVGKKNDNIKINKGALFKVSMFDEKFVNMPENYNCNDWIHKHTEKTKKVSVNYKNNF